MRWKPRILLCYGSLYRHFKDENYPELHLTIQSVPRSKHTPSQLYKPVS
jgi:hypothetical protein